MKFCWEDFKSLCLRFKEFFPNFFIFLIFFIIGIGIGYFVGVPVQMGLIFLGVPFRISFVISRIIISIAPFFPIMYLWKNRYKSKSDEEDIEGSVMDCYFTAWIFFVFMLWVIL